MKHGAEARASNFNPALFLVAIAAMVGGSVCLQAQDEEPAKDGRQQAANATKPSSQPDRNEVIITEDGYEETLKPIPEAGIYEVVGRRKLSPAELPDWHPLRQKRTDLTWPALGAVAGMGFMSLLMYAKYQHDKKAIIHEIKRRRGSVEDIRLRIGLVNSKYDVTYLDDQGVHRSGTCTVQGWGWSVYWKTESTS